MTIESSVTADSGEISAEIHWNPHQIARVMRRFDHLAKVAVQKRHVGAVVRKRVDGRWVEIKRL
jgi:hypothetical protein